jgi:hypothetical protein
MKSLKSKPETFWHFEGDESRFPHYIKVVGKSPQRIYVINKSINSNQWCMIDHCDAKYFNLYRWRYRQVTWDDFVLDRI